MALDEVRTVQPSIGATLLVETGLLVGGALTFLAIRSHGEGLLAPLGASLSTGSKPILAHGASPVFHLLFALAAVIAVGQILARIFAFLHQPPVIGEVVAGILLGPSLLGAEASAWVLPPPVAPLLGAMAQLGVVLYMFLVGLELNGEVFKRHGRTTLIVSSVGIVFPFLLGSLLAVELYPRLGSRDVAFTGFALFMGVAMSITAFPVLARILTDMKMSRTPIGELALGCAAVGDVTAWCLLAFVVGVVKTSVEESTWVILGTLLYLAAMMLIVRPLAQRLAPREGAEEPGRPMIAFTFVALLLSAAATERIGIHALFGAFALGAVIPHESALARVFTRHLETLVTTLFLPAFFALTGMRTRIDLVAGAEAWTICGVIIVTATVGKFVGSALAARGCGIDRRSSAVIGLLMNTRGLMELIVLDVGLDLGVISPTLYSMMVVMALVTTMATSPILRRLRPG